MTVRLEWLTATATHVVVVPADTIAPDGQTAEAPGASVLVLGHGDSYGVAIEGTTGELAALLERALRAIQA